MSEQIDNPLHSQAIDSALVKLDSGELADKSNALTGGCLRGQDAIKVARMVSFAAIRTPGKTVSVAGITGRYDDDKLYVAYSADIVTIDIPRTSGDL